MYRLPAGGKLPEEAGIQALKRKCIEYIIVR